MPQNIKALDFFSGLGGGSLGLKRAGVKVLGGVDIDETACKYYEKNLQTPTLCADLRDLNYEEVLSALEVKKQEVDLVMGCPPCQNFSSLRDTRPWPEDAPKDELLLTFLDHIEEGKPALIIFENVPGIVKSDGGKYLQYFTTQMREMGYCLKWKKVNSADFGVPQNRERIIAFGVFGVDEGKIKFPEPSHANPECENLKNKEPWVTVENAIGDLPSLKSGESSSVHNHEARNHQSKTLERFKHIPKDGGNRKDMPKRLWLDCHKNLNGAETVYSRMWWDQPAPTLTTRCTSPSSGRFIHPAQDRGITVREAARIQTFPDEHRFPDNKEDASRLIGNAVPPRLIEMMVKEFINSNEGVLSG